MYSSSFCCIPNRMVLRRMICRQAAYDFPGSLDTSSLTAKQNPSKPQSVTVFPGPFTLPIFLRMWRDTCWRLAAWNSFLTEKYSAGISLSWDSNSLYMVRGTALSSLCQWFAHPSPLPVWRRLQYVPNGHFSFHFSFQMNSGSFAYNCITEQFRSKHRKGIIHIWQISLS